MKGDYVCFVRGWMFGLGEDEVVTVLVRGFMGQGSYNRQRVKSVG